jgi:hypothetical protein
VLQFLSLSFGESTQRGREVSHYQITTLSITTSPNYFMEVITLESQAFKDLMDKINTIAKFVVTYQPQEINEEEAWVDSYEVCTFLKISERTLQRLRTKGLISYSIISGKTYYTIAEVKRMLKDRLVRSSQESLENLIQSHKTYVEQRRNTRTDK